MKVLKIALYVILYLIVCFISIQLYFFIKHKGNLVVLVNFESSIKEAIDIRVSVDNQVLIQDTVLQDAYYIVAGKSKFIKPGKHIVTIESTKRAFKKEYSINIYFFKYIMINYFPPISYHEEGRVVVNEDWKPIFIE